MKAFLLAAGLGTRLRPITDSLPKCLVTVAGRPLLGHWFDLLERYGVADVLVNLHHYPEQVNAYIRDYSGPINLVTVMEPDLLGSAGTLYANKDFVRGEEAFLILYADNLTNVDLGALIGFNHDHPALLTVGLMHMDMPSTRGIATLGDDGTIVRFVEKPEHPESDIASAGLFVARQEIFQEILPNRRPYDFGNDVMPRLVGRMNGTLLDGYLRDIGTHESLALAEREWSRPAANKEPGLL